MNIKTKELLNKRNEAEDSMNKLEEQINNLSRQIWEIEGNCPHCRNAHFPFCGYYSNPRLENRESGRT